MPTQSEAKPGFMAVLKLGLNGLTATTDKMKYGARVHKFLSHSSNPDPRAGVGSSQTVFHQDASKKPRPKAPKLTSKGSRTRSSKKVAFSSGPSGSSPSKESRSKLPTKPFFTSEPLPLRKSTLHSGFEAPLLLHAVPHRRSPPPHHPLQESPVYSPKVYMTKRKKRKSSAELSPAHSKVARRDADVHGHGTPVSLQQFGHPAAVPHPIHFPEFRLFGSGSHSSASSLVFTDSSPSSSSSRSHSPPGSTGSWGPPPGLPVQMNTAPQAHHAAGHSGSLPLHNQQPHVTEVHHHHYHAVQQQYPPQGHHPQIYLQQSHNPQPVYPPSHSHSHSKIRPKIHYPHSYAAPQPHMLHATYGHHTQSQPGTSIHAPRVHTMPQQHQPVYPPNFMPPAGAHPYPAQPYFSTAHMQPQQYIPHPQAHHQFVAPEQQQFSFNYPHHTRPY